MEEGNHEVKYAGFWVRFLAFVIDGWILSIPITIIGWILGENSWMSIILIVVVWWLYGAKMLSSSWKATIGKKIVAIQVLTNDYKQLTFKQASLRYVYSFISYIFILPIFMMFFNQKKQTFHDYLNKNIVVDTYETKKFHAIKENIEKPKKIVGYIRGIGIISFILIQAYIIYIFSMVVVWYFSMATGSQKAYDNSFHIKYQTNDYNDSKIIFYNKELQKYSEAFVRADGMYDIFAADTKKDLALNCIQASLKEHNASDWIEEGSYFRKNARNMYAKTEDEIKKAKANAHYAQLHFYDYDLNDVDKIESSIASIWDSKKNINTCGKLIPIEQMYSQFMVQYFQNREDALTSYQSSYIRATDKSTLNKSFYKQHIEQTESWLQVLEKNNPDILQNIEAYKKKKEEEKQKYIASLPQKRYEEKVKNLWLNAHNGALSGSRTFQDFNATIRNKKGQTPLMIAVKNGYVSVVKMHNVAIADVWTKDNEGKTAFDYISASKDKEEKIKNERLLEALKIVEIRQLIRGKAYITKSIFDTNSTILKIVIGGGKCKDFTFPDNTDCKVKKKRINHPIFAAIKDKDNAQFDKYLKEVNIDIQDPWKQSLLWTALLWRNIYVVDKLLSMGTDINQLNNMKKRTPLQNAVIDKNIALLKILVKYGIETKSTDIVYIEKMKKLLKGEKK